MKNEKQLITSLKTAAEEMDGRCGGWLIYLSDRAYHEEDDNAEGAETILELLIAHDITFTELCQVWSDHLSCYLTKEEEHKEWQKLADEEYRKVETENA